MRDGPADGPLGVARELLELLPLGIMYTYEYIYIYIYV